MFPVNELDLINIKIGVANSVINQTGSEADNIMLAHSIIKDALNRLKEIQYTENQSLEAGHHNYM
jgi:hypothetical protein